MIELLKFVYRLIKGLTTFIIVILPLQLVGILILYPVCYLVGPKPLPAFLRWFDNADQYIGRDTSVYFSVRDSGTANIYYWLAIRNPLNYFGYQVLGVTLSGTELQTLHTALDSINVGDGTNDHEGLLYSEVKQEDKTYYEYYYIKKYAIFKQIKCFRFRLGHKFTEISKNSEHVQWCFIISPYHSYDGV